MAKRPENMHEVIEELRHVRDELRVQMHLAAAPTFGTNGKTWRRNGATSASGPSRLARQPARQPRMSAKPWNWSVKSYAKAIEESVKTFAA